MTSTTVSRCYGLFHLIPAFRAILNEATGLEEKETVGHALDHSDDIAIELIPVNFFQHDFPEVDMSYDVNDLQTAWWLVGSWYGGALNIDGGGLIHTKLQYVKPQTVPPPSTWNTQYAGHQRVPPTITHSLPPHPTSNPSTQQRPAPATPRKPLNSISPPLPQRTEPFISPPDPPHSPPPPRPSSAARTPL